MEVRSAMTVSYQKLAEHLTELKMDHKNGTVKSDKLTVFLVGQACPETCCN